MAEDQCLTDKESVPRNLEEMQAWVREQFEIEGVAAEVVRLDDARALEKRLRREIELLRHKLVQQTSIVRWLLLDVLARRETSADEPDARNGKLHAHKRRMLIDWLEDPKFRVGLDLQLGRSVGNAQQACAGSLPDCQNRLAVCRAACCRRSFPLSIDEVRQGRLQWSLDEPFLRASGPDGYCVHLDRATLRCTVYEDRPEACTSYTCEHDEQVWEDFSARLLNPALRCLLDSIWDEWKLPTPNGEEACSNAPDRP